MSDLRQLIFALSEQQITDNVALIHERARRAYPREPADRVRDQRHLEAVFGDYLAYHVRATGMAVATIARFDAVARAKQLALSGYRRRAGNRDATMANLLDTAVSGARGGVWEMLDDIAEGLKQEAVQHYTDEVIDRFVRIGDWSDRVQIARQFLDMYGEMLPERLRRQPAESIAANFKELIQMTISQIRTVGDEVRRI